MARGSVAGQELDVYIIEGLFRLLEKKPFADISIREITQRSGVSRSTYYRHFSCKEDIVRCFFRLLFQEYMEEYEKNAGTSLLAARSSIFHCFYRRREQLLLLYQNDLLYLLLETFRSYLGVSEEGAALQAYGAAYHIGGMYNVLRLWLSRDMRETPEEITQLALEIIRQGYMISR